MVHVTCFLPDGSPASLGSGAIFTPDGYGLTKNYRGGRVYVPISP